LSATIAAVGVWALTVSIVAELHTEPRHTKVGPWQSALLVHIVLHAPALQT
jgi:hypothetical protein